MLKLRLNASLIYLFGSSPAEWDVGRGEEVAEASEGGWALGTRIGGVGVEGVEAQPMAPPRMARSRAFGVWKFRMQMRAN